MSWMFTVLLVVQILSSLAIISLVLLQQGKGADMGSAFGSGSAGSLFGATGAANFMSRVTKWAAVVFFISTIGLAYVANRGTKGQDTGIMQNFTQTAQPPLRLDRLFQAWRLLHQAVQHRLPPRMPCRAFRQCRVLRLLQWCQVCPHRLRSKGLVQSETRSACYNLGLDYRVRNRCKHKL